MSDVTRPNVRARDVIIEYATNGCDSSRVETLVDEAIEMVRQELVDRKGIIREARAMFSARGW